MESKIDELLNRYIDNELDSSELSELSNMMKSNNDIIQNLKSLEMVKNSLKTLPVFEAPKEFTHIFMEKLSDLSVSKKQKPVFFYTVVSIFCVFIIISILFAFYYPMEYHMQATSTITSLGSQISSIFRNLFIPEIHINKNVQNLIGYSAVFVFFVCFYSISKSLKKNREIMKTYSN